MDKNSAQNLKKVYDLLNSMDDDAKSHLVTNLYHTAEILAEEEYEDEWKRIDDEYKSYMGESAGATEEAALEVIDGSETDAELEILADDATKS